MDTKKKSYYNPSLDDFSDDNEPKNTFNNQTNKNKEFAFDDFDEFQDQSLITNPFLDEEPAEPIAPKQKTNRFDNSPNTNTFNTTPSTPPTNNTFKPIQPAKKTSLNPHAPKVTKNKFDRALPPFTNATFYDTFAFNYWNKKNTRPEDGVFSYPIVLDTRNKQVRDAQLTLLNKIMNKQWPISRLEATWFTKLWNSGYFDAIVNDNEELINTINALNQANSDIYKTNVQAMESVQRPFSLNPYLNNSVIMNSVQNIKHPEVYQKKPEPFYKDADFFDLGLECQWYFNQGSWHLKPWANRPDDVDGIICQVFPEWYEDLVVHAVDQSSPPDFNPTLDLTKTQRSFLKMNLSKYYLDFDRLYSPYSGTVWSAYEVGLSPIYMNYYYQNLSEDEITKMNEYHFTEGSDYDYYKDFLWPNVREKIKKARAKAITNTAIQTTKPKKNNL